MDFNNEITYISWDFQLNLATLRPKRVFSF